jgi:hypothetical protein
LGDDAIRTLDLLLNNLELLGSAGIAVFEALLERVSGVVNDCERVLDFMREFRGQAPGGVQLSFAQRKFASFLGYFALALQQDLDAIRTDRHQEQ